MNSTYQLCFKWGSLRDGHQVLFATISNSQPSTVDSWLDSQGVVLLDSLFRRERTQLLPDSLKRFSIDGKSMTAPKYDRSFDTLLSHFWQLILDHADEMIRIASRFSPRAPFIEGYTTDVVWTAPRGIYLNYTIKEAYFYPEDSTLVVLTNYPYTGVGGDSMHGAMIVKVSKIASIPEKGNAK